MQHHAGLDVSLEETSVCIVDGAGKIIRETQVASEPEALVGYFSRSARPDNVCSSCLSVARSADESIV